MAGPRRPSMASETSIPESTQELGSMYDYLIKVILLGPSGSGKSCLLHRFLKDEWRVLSSQTIGVEFASKIIRVGTGPRRKRMKFQLWDTAGTERFRAVSRSYYRGAAGAILVYDIASSASFQALPTFLMDAKALASPNLTVLLAGNKLDLTAENTPPRPNSHTSQDEWASSRPPATPSSVSSKQSNFPPDTTTTTCLSPLRSPTLPTLGSDQTATRAPEGREVSSEAASRWASKTQIPVAVEVSALSGDNVDALFTRLARMILTKIELGEVDPDDPQSGIHYGDAAGWAGDSVRSGVDDDQASVRRRRGWRKGGGGGARTRNAAANTNPGTGTTSWMAGMREWEDVFRIPGSNPQRRKGACC